MKNAIVKAAALAIIALALLFVGASTVYPTADFGIAVCHDGPTNVTVVQ